MTTHLQPSRRPTNQRKAFIIRRIRKLITLPCFCSPARLKSWMSEPWGLGSDISILQNFFLNFAIYRGLLWPETWKKKKKNQMFLWILKFLSTVTAIEKFSTSRPLFSWRNSRWKTVRTQSTPPSIRVKMKYYLFIRNFVKKSQSESFMTKWIFGILI